MKLNNGLKPLLVVLAVILCLSLYYGTTRVAEAQGTPFNNLSVGDYVKIQDNNGQWHTWRIFDVGSRRLVYGDSSMTFGQTADWSGSRSAGDSLKMNFPGALVDITGPGLLTLDEITTVTQAAYTVTGSVYTYIPNDSLAATSVLKTGYSYWTYTGSGGDAWRVDSSGDIEERNGSFTFAVRPALTLQPDLETAGGSGTAPSPYTLRPINNDPPNSPGDFQPGSDVWLKEKRPSISFTLLDPAGDRLSAYEIVISDTPISPDTASAERITGSWASGERVTYTRANNLSDGIHYVYVRAMDQWNQWGDWGSTQIKVDATAPGKPTINITPSAAGGQWSNQEVTFTVTDGDDNGSGVQMSEYSTDGGNTWNTYAASPVTISEEGATVIQARSVDKAGNTGETVGITVLVDKTAPTSPTINFAPDDEWTNADEVTVTLTDGTDTAGAVDSSGVAHSEYSQDGGQTWHSYDPDNPIAITAEGQSAIQARTVDNAGNLSDVTAKTVKIDRTQPTAPTVTLSVYGWTNDDGLNFSISGGDDTDSGVKGYQYSLNGTGNWLDYPGQGVPVTTEGETVIYARSVDNAGNVSAPSAPVTARLDKTAPKAPTIVPSTTDWASKVTFTIRDNGDLPGGGTASSGVQKIQYRFSTNDPWMDYSPADPTAGVMVPGEGKLNIYARALDNAGNVSSESTQIVQVDQTVPGIPTINAPADWTNDRSFTITDGADSVSGVQKSQYMILGYVDSWTDYNGKVTLPAVVPDGPVTIKARTLDNAGNISEAAELTMKIDTTPPTKPVVNPGTTDWTQNTSFTITAGTEPGPPSSSGAAGTEYRTRTDGNGSDWTDWQPYTGAVSIDDEGLTEIQARTIDNAGNSAESEVATVRIDRTPPPAPEVQLTAPDGGDLTAVWTNQDVTLILTDKGDNLSGTVRLEYKIGANGAWNAYTGQVSISTQGQQDIYAHATDAAGNVSDESQPGTVSIDKTPPTAPTIMNVPTGWTQGPVNISITPGTDDMSGVDKTEYKIGEGDWIEYSGGDIPINDEGEVSTQARTFDKAGNSAEAAPVTVRIDNTRPTAPSVTSDVYGWTNKAVNVTITSGTDAGSGVQRTEYKVGEGDWQSFTGEAETITVDREGETVVYARTIDNVNLESDVTAYTVRIDVTPPGTPTVSATTEGWTTDDVAITIADGADQADLSGVDKSQYRLGENGEWQDVPQEGLAVINTEGETQVYARTLDNAGNEAVAQPVAIRIDRTPPGVPTINAPSGWTAAPAVVTITPGTDEIGEVDQVQFRLNPEGEWQTYTGLFTIDTEGETTVEAKTIDKAGNESPAATSVVRIDSAGEASLRNGEDYSGDVTLNDPGDSYGPVEGGSTVEGNVTIAEDGIILQNVTVKGDVTVAGENVTLRNITIAGNLTVSEQVKEDFTADKVTVQGDAIINGGALDTVTFTDSRLNHVIVNKDQVHLVFDGSTGVSGTVTVNQASTLTLNTTGVIEMVEVKADGVKIDGSKGTINEVTVASGMQVEIGSAITVKKGPGSSNPPSGGGGGGSGGGGGGGGGGGATSSASTRTITVPANTSGTASLNDEISIDIPGGTFDEQVDITIRAVKDFEPLPPTDQLVLVSPVFDVTLNSAQDFKKPVTMSIQYDKEMAKEMPVAVHYFDEGQKAWMKLGGEVNGDSVSVLVNHFTAFAVFAEIPQKPEPSDTENSGTEGQTAPNIITFTDIHGHWAESSIERAVSEGFVKGYPNGTFRPNLTVTRDQFAVMLGSVLNLKGDAESMTLVDREQIPDWAAPYVAGAIEAGIVSGYDDNTFRPNGNISRAEMAVMLVKALKLPVDENAALDFADAGQIPQWAKPYVATAVKYHLFGGREGNRFAPSDSATRAEASVVLLNTLKILGTN